MSAFETSSFLSGTYDQGADTRFPLHRAGEWGGIVGTGENDISEREVDTKDGKRKMWEVWLYADDPAAQAEGFEPPARCRYTMWLDFNTAGTALDFSAGKNRQLGSLLTALGFQDKSGKMLKERWSPIQWKGMRLRYQVKHETRKDNGEVVANVSAVTAAG